MKRLTYPATIFFALATAGAAFAQSSMGTPQGGYACAMDYNCNTQSKGIGTVNTGIGTGSAYSNDPNAVRLRSELSPPRSSSGPEEPEPPIDQPIEPEGPITK